MSRPDPIQYAELLYAAIRAANFSTLSFLAFGNAVKDGVELRRMPRLAAEPFMRVVGEMLNLEEENIESIEVSAVDSQSDTAPGAAGTELDIATAIAESGEARPPTPDPARGEK
jgi:hypothetical protein